MSGYTPSPNITITSSPLPANAAQETGGNLQILDLKFPNQAALVDGYVVPNTTIMGSAGLSLNSGNTWDRLRSGITTNSTVVTGYQNVITVGRYNATPTVRTEGQLGPLQTSTKGSLMVMDEQVAPSGVLADAVANYITSTYANATLAFNGTTWDRVRSGSTTIGSATTGYMNTLGMAVYNSSPTVRTDGYNGPFQADLYGNIKTAEAYSPNYEDNTNQIAATALRYLANGAYSPGLLVADFGATVTKNAKASAGIVTQLIAKSREVGIVWLQLHNTATTPSAAAVPALSIEMAPGEQKLIGAELLSINGFKFGTGVAYSWSSTAGTYTACSTASLHDVQIIGV